MVQSCALLQLALLGYKETRCRAFLIKYLPIVIVRLPLWNRKWISGVDVQCAVCWALALRSRFTGIPPSDWIYLLGVHATVNGNDKSLFRGSAERRIKPPRRLCNSSTCSFLGRPSNKCFWITILLDRCCAVSDASGISICDVCKCAVVVRRRKFQFRGYLWQKFRYITIKEIGKLFVISSVAVNGGGCGDDGAMQI